MFHQIMTGVYAHQAVTTAVLGVKRFPYAALVLPLFVATAAFHWAAGALFKRPWAVTSLREAAALDARDGTVGARGSGGARLLPRLRRPAI